MTGVLFSLLPLFFWGISDYVSGRMARGLHPSSINLFFAFTIGVPTVIVCSFFGLPEITLDISKNFLITSTFLTMGFLSQLIAFKHGLAGVVAPIANAYAVVTLIVVVLFLGVSTSVAQVLSVLVVVSGIFLLSFNSSKEEASSRKSVFYALLAMTLFGIGFALYDVAATQEWYANAILFQLSSFILAVLVSLIWTRKRTWLELKKVIPSKLGYYGAVAAGTGTIGLFLAIENVDNVAIPATIAAASPLVTVVLARHYDKERLFPRQYVAALVVVTGIILLGINS